MNVPIAASGAPSGQNLAVPLQAPAGNQIAEEAHAFDVRLLYQIIRRNLLAIAGVVAACLVVGLIVTLLMTPKYEAVASVQIDQESERILASQDTEVASSQDADRYLQTQADVLRSRTMAERVVQQLRLTDDTAFFAAMGAERPATPNGQKAKATLAATKLVMNNLVVNLPRGSRVVQLSFISSSPSVSAKVANAYADGFIEYNLQRKFDASAYARSFLSRQLAETKVKLEASERDLNNYARQAGLIKTAAPSTTGSAGANSVTTSSLVQMNEAANQAETDRIQAEQKWRSAASVPVMSIPDVLSNSAIQGLLQLRASKTAELSNELAIHRDAYPTVQNLKAQVADIDSQIQTLAGSIRSSIRDRYQVALRQEQSVKGQVAQLKGATLAEQDRGVRYNILSREADTNRTLYDGLLQRFKEVSAEAGITTNNISIVDRADPPTRPSSPKLYINLAIAFVAGLLLALALVFIREQVDDTVRAPGDVERKLSMPLLGVIPKVGEDEDVLDLLDSPRASISEAYHALRTSLMYSTVEGLPQVLLVTSTQASEGKSTTSFALASDLARLGLRILLIDTDLRRPSLHRVLSMPNKLGLSTVLTHNCEPAEAIVPVGENTTMSFLPAGPVPPSPTELLASPAMREVVHKLRRDFDVIVLDGSPVLGLAAAAVLSALADATAFVVEANRGHRGATKTALRRLQTAHSRMLGVILTKFDARKAGAAEYYGYDYYYYGIEDGTKNA